MEVEPFPLNLGHKCHNSLAMGSSGDMKAVSKSNGHPSIAIPLMLGDDKYLVRADQAEKGTALRLVGKFFEKGGTISVRSK